MKYILNPSTGALEETAKIGEEKTASQKQLEKLAIQPNHNGKLWKDYVAKNKKTEKLINSAIIKNNINDKPITSLDYINRVQHMYNEQPLNESNKMKDAARAAANKKNNLDPNRPAFSASDVVFASMNHKEAREFTGGYDKEKIKLLREVKSRLRKQEAYDKQKLMNTEEQNENKKI